MKETELETVEYNNRLKIQNELMRVKVTEEDLIQKYKNCEDKIKIKKELVFKNALSEYDYLKSNSIKKVDEEIEQFKLEFDSKLELEKQILYNKKVEVEEKEFKYNHLFKKYRQEKKKMLYLLKILLFLNKRTILLLRKIPN